MVFFVNNVYKGFWFIGYYKYYFLRADYIGIIVRILSLVLGVYRAFLLAYLRYSVLFANYSYSLRDFFWVVN